MVELIVLIVVFAAVSWGVWVLTPIMAQIGMERSVGKYVRGGESAATNVMYRFTTPERLARSCWSAALLGCGSTSALLIALDVLNVYMLLGCCVLAGALCYQIPRLWLRNKIKQRQRQFDVRLLDLILGMANGLRAGSALPQTIEMVSRDIGGPITEEFSLVLHEYRLGIDLPESLARLTRRMQGEDLSLFVTSVRLTIQSGGSLAEVLDRITDTIRHRTDFHERLRTMTEQGRFEAIAMASAPLVCFLILFYLDRELMQPMVETTMGWCAIGVVLIFETIGFLWINKIVTIEV
ncbi:MAG: type II secretion system F family protein [Kiritimatiellae bacterium]|nr:type II secretion system F family protein [Kiritimatiellia bacterium]